MKRPELVELRRTGASIRDSGEIVEVTSGGRS
jgi:hypothetical protein